MKIILTQNQNNFPPNSFSQSRKRCTRDRPDVTYRGCNIVRYLEPDDCRQSGRTEIGRLIARRAAAASRDRIALGVQCSLKDAHIFTANAIVQITRKYNGTATHAGTARDNGNGL
jgi:hypothetical protein